MKLLYRRCAGLDVHKKSISVCVRIRRSGSKQAEVHEAEFRTFTQDLERLRDWLKQHKVKQVAMESTGVYWIPVWNILEPVSWGFELLLVNPQTVRALRGCKTDRIDARRIAEFLQYGLLHGSFVPPRPIRQLRDLTRMRVQVQHDRNRVINRIGRLLETVNIKLGSVASNIVGKSGCAMLKAIAKGETRPENLAKLALGQLQNKKAELALAFQGRYSDHFRWLLRGLVAELEWLDGKLAELDTHLAAQMEPHAELVKRLCSIPGVHRVTAWVLIAELDLEMSQFPDAKHAASWAGLCPGNAESAGKRFSGRTRKGDRYLRRILVQNAWAVAHMKDCFLTAVFYRIAHHRGMKKAAVSVAHRILVIAYHIIRDGTEYWEQGGDYFDRLHPDRTVARLTRRLMRIGYDVTLTPHTPVPLTSNDPAPRPKRGRPCLCAVRGIACPHPLPTPPKHSPQPRHHLPCSKCAKWGIPCIHVRPRKPGGHFSTSPPESTT